MANIWKLVKEVQTKTHSLVKCLTSH